MGVLSRRKGLSLSSRVLRSLSCIVTDVRHPVFGSKATSRGAHTCVGAVRGPGIGVVNRYSSRGFPMSCFTLFHTTVRGRILLRVGGDSLDPSKCHKSAACTSLLVLGLSGRFGCPILFSDSDRNARRVNSFRCTRTLTQGTSVPRSLVLGCSMHGFVKFLNREWCCGVRKVLAVKGYLFFSTSKAVLSVMGKAPRSAGLTLRRLEGGKRGAFVYANHSGTFIPRCLVGRVKFSKLVTGLKTCVRCGKAQIFRHRVPASLT